MFTGTVFGQKYIHDSGTGSVVVDRTFNVTMSRNIVAKRVIEQLTEDSVFFATNPGPDKTVTICVALAEKNALVNAIETWEAKVAF